MAEDKSSVLLSDVSIEGDLIEKDKIILDAKINGEDRTDRPGVKCDSASQIPSNPNSSA